MQYLTNIDKDSAYIRGGLYLPHSRVNTAVLKNALTFFTELQDPIYQYLEFPKHIRVPRNFLDIKKIEARCKVVNKLPKKYKEVTIKSKITLRSKLQEDSFSSLQDKSGILVLPCGEGKTVIALHEIARRKVPTLIIVNTEQLMYQWKDSINTFLDVSSVGKIQGKTWEYKHPIVLGMLQTIAKQRDQLPPELRKYFGLVVWDEVDEIATRVYSSTADIFYGSRIGITATPKRKDRAEKIFEYHIGPILYSNTEFKKTPNVFFVQTELNLFPHEYMNVWNDKVNYGKLYTKISKDEKRDKLALKLINKKLKEGRKILVLGERKDQLYRLHEEIENSGLCVAEVDLETRASMLNNCRVIFAIRKLSKRGLNQPDLDTLVLLFPMSEEGGIKQAVGRILRTENHKLPPEVYVCEDIYVPPMKEICRKMRNTFVKWEFNSSNYNL